MKRLLLMALVLAILTPAAMADDWFPPPWRGEPGTTWQGWEFDTDIPDPLPDFGVNPYGDPTIIVQPGIGQQWLPDWEQRPGVWPLSGTINVDIPNSPIPNPFKEIWVQLTWLPQVQGEYALEIWGESELFPGVQVPAHEVNNEILPDGWNHTTFSIILEPNPPFEHIFIGGTVMVDELVIDTWCVPEPATMSLMGIAGLVALRRRR